MNQQVDVSVSCHSGTVWAIAKTMEMQKCFYIGTIERNILIVGKLISLLNLKKY